MSETTVDITSLWDSAKVGEPEPPYDDGPACLRLGPLLLLCTRRRDHAGQHVATDGIAVLAVWIDSMIDSFESEES